MKKGFTLIEIMVAVSIFVIVSTIVAGALVSVSQTNRQAQAIKTAMDNLNFALTSMVFNLRSGINYIGVQSGNNSQLDFDEIVDRFEGDLGNDCSSNKCEALVFTTDVPSDPNRHNQLIAYRLVKTTGPNNIGKLQVFNQWYNSDWVDMTSTDLDITDASFVVRGNGQSPKEPRVTIVISGQTTDQTHTPFNIQTTVRGSR